MNKSTKENAKPNASLMKQRPKWRRPQPEASRIANLEEKNYLRVVHDQTCSDEEGTDYSRDSKRVYRAKPPRTRVEPAPQCKPRVPQDRAESKTEVLSDADESSNRQLLDEEIRTYAIAAKDFEKTAQDAEVRARAEAKLQQVREQIAVHEKPRATVASLSVAVLVLLVTIVIWTGIVVSLYFLMTVERSGSSEWCDDSWILRCSLAKPTFWQMMASETAGKWDWLHYISSYKYVTVQISPKPWVFAILLILGPFFLFLQVFAIYNSVVAYLRRLYSTMFECPPALPVRDQLQILARVHNVDVNTLASACLLAVSCGRKASDIRVLTSKIGSLFSKSIPSAERVDLTTVHLQIAINNNPVLRNFVSVCDGRANWDQLLQGHKISRGEYPRGLVSE